jgi:transcription elongation factor GreB
MSKAFTKETDSDEDELPEEADVLPASLKNYVTPRGLRQMQQELRQLMREERPKIVEIVSWAAGNGDRSENGDYIYGKRRLREIDSRVRFLTKRIDTVEVVEELPTDRERIFFGAWVTVEGEDGKQQIYRIVGPDEFDLSQNKLSMDSPLARALLGKRIDDDIVFNSPAGERELYIAAVSYVKPKPVTP